MEVEEGVVCFIDIKIIYLVEKKGDFGLRLFLNCVIIMEYRIIENRGDKR